MIGRTIFALALIGGASSAFAQSTGPVLLTQRSLTLDAAHQLASVALESCRKNGFNVTIVVLDAAGRLRVQLHDDKAGPHTLENARRKAYTSLTFRLNSADFGKRYTGDNRPPMLDGITTGAGGVVIKAGEEVVGSVGVSGAPGGEKDQACAEAGIATIAAGLK